MTTEEIKEHADLIAKWNATDITPEQTERLEQLDAIASLSHTSISPEASWDREEIIDTAAHAIREKYNHGQREHNTDLPTGGLGFFVRATREEALDLIAYTHHLGKKVEALHELQQRMASGEINMPAAAEELFTIISETPPQKNGKLTDLP